MFLSSRVDERAGPNGTFWSYKQKRRWNRKIHSTIGETAKRRPRRPAGLGLGFRFCLFVFALMGPIQTTLNLSKKISETKNKKQNWRAIEPHWSDKKLAWGLAQVPHYPETRASPGGSLHRAWSFGIRSGRHAHAPGSSSASCCCSGSVGLNRNTTCIWYEYV